MECGTGTPILELDDAHGNVYRCKHCRTHLALTDDIISKVRHASSRFDSLAPSQEELLAIYEISDYWTWCFGSDPYVQDFYCKDGKAYLFDKVVNVSVGENEDRMMITGMHTVSDIFCVRCGVILGWKYEVAFERTQKYKEGKFILARNQLLGPE